MNVLENTDIPNFSNGKNAQLRMCVSKIITPSLPADDSRERPLSARAAASWPPLLLGDQAASFCLPTEPQRLPFSLSAGP